MFSPRKPMIYGQWNDAAPMKSTGSSSSSTKTNPLFAPTPSPPKATRFTPFYHPYAPTPGSRGSSPSRRHPIQEIYGDETFKSFCAGRGFHPTPLATPKPEDAAYPTPSSTPSPSSKPRPDPAAAATLLDERLQAMRRHWDARRAEGWGTKSSRGCGRSASWLSQEDRRRSRLCGDSLLAEKRREERRRQKINEDFAKRAAEAEAKRLDAERQRLAEEQQRKLEGQMRQNQAAERWASYSTQWEWILRLPRDIPEQDLMTTRHLALPVLVVTQFTGASGISKSDLEAFFYSDAHSQGKTRKERVRAALLTVS